ncbi:MAG: hypothetical protein MJZ35_00685 [Bacteroidaceae bacterium]|nr:hypothetical protein [Bacteroidaceae bacterium]
MKKIFIMLLIACTAMATLNAQTQQRRTTNTPKNVIGALDFIIGESGNKDNQVYRVTKNPVTNILESKEQIVHFVCGVNDPMLLQVSQRFMNDEPVCYQISHLAAGKIESFSIKVVTENGKKTNYVTLRNKPTQEMWYMATKNASNPQLRDVYAIVWEQKDQDHVEGDIYIISSLRPDLFEKDMERDRSKTFTLDGRMGDDISDSLYVFYMAETYEELNQLTMMTDSYAELKEYMKTHSNILPMPVSRDKRFNVSVDIDKRMGGRIRTVMPDGSLCKFWTNIDMVPGKTYRITTHNGFYSADWDYENRFGLRSGKSMFEGHDNDDVELTGGYEDEETDIVVPDTVADWREDDVYAKPAPRQTGNKLEEMTQAQQMELMLDVQAIKAEIERSKELSKIIGACLKEQPGVTKDWKAVDPTLNQLMKSNAALDKRFESFIKKALKYGLDKAEAPEAYKDGILKHYAEQAKGFAELYQKCGSLSKTAQKCQKQVNKLIEKNMNDMIKLTTK